MGESEGAMAQMERKENIEWKRASEVFPGATLFGRNGITIEDLVQGFVSNSWFTSAISTVAEYPGRIEKLFLNNQNELSRTGIYGMNIYTLGFPQTILVDDFLPLTNKKGKSSTLYAELSNNGALWGAIMEKVLAKRFGNYEHIIAGLPSEAMKFLTGAPYVTY